MFSRLYSQCDTILLTTSFFLFICFPYIVQADTKSIVSEATYTMGDGETPHFAEAMALQKAKQAALEQAGTYVESYTQVRNLDVTGDEIRTIAGGVLETEIVEKNRTLLKDGGERFFIKISARVTTDNIEGLARRLKGTNIVEENRQILETYAKIASNLNLLKKQIAETKSESEREIVLDKIREVEKDFRQVRTTETLLHKQLLSGQELSEQVNKTLAAKQKRQEEEQRRRDWQDHAVLEFIGMLQANRYTITIGSPETDVLLDDPGTVILGFPVGVHASDEMNIARTNFERAYSGDTPPHVDGQVEELLKGLSLGLIVALNNGTQYRSELQPLEFKSPRTYDLKMVLRDRGVKSFVTVQIPRQHIKQVSSVEGFIIRDKHKSP